LSAQAQDERPLEGSALLRVSAHGAIVGPVVCRVISMVLARADCPMDKLDDALLVCDALSAHAPSHARNEHLSFQITACPGSAEVRVGELADGGARGLVREAELPGVGNVLERVAHELRYEPSTDGSGAEDLVVSLRFE
jgi:hypothetical protein